MKESFRWDIVREKINLLPSAAMHFAYEHNMPIFHCACGNMSVSLEIIECLLTAFPSAVYCQYGGSEAFPLRTLHVTMRIARVK